MTYFKNWTFRKREPLEKVDPGLVVKADPLPKFTILVHGVIILNRSNTSYVSVETSAPQQAGGFTIKCYFEISNITPCR